MRRVVFNKKGGVGKSTITCNLAALSAVQGHRTLVIDLDPQANTTQYLMGSVGIPQEQTVFHFFDSMLSFMFRAPHPSEFVHFTPFANLELMPAHPEMEELQGKLESRYKMFKLREALDDLDYDRIFIDTPPALGFFTRSALIACPRCLIPFDCDSFSKNALYALLENVNEIRLDHNRDLTVEGIIVNQFQSRAKFPVQIVEELLADELPVLKTYLSSSVKVRESHGESQPLVLMDPGHKVSKEFQQLYEELEADS